MIQKKKHFKIFEQINNKPKGCCYNCLSRSINCVETLQLANIDLKIYITPSNDHMNLR